MKDSIVTCQACTESECVDRCFGGWRLGPLSVQAGLKRHHHSFKMTMTNACQSPVILGGDFSCGVVSRGYRYGVNSYLFSRQ